MVGRATIRLGIGPDSSLVYFCFPLSSHRSTVASTVDTQRNILLAVNKFPVKGNDVRIIDFG